MDFDSLFQAVSQILTPWPFLMMFIGTVLGIVVGAIPGLTGAMLIALTLPLTFYMVPFNAIVLLVAMYVGAISGGLITATLMRMPGTPADPLRAWLNTVGRGGRRAKFCRMICIPPSAVTLF